MFKGKKNTFQKIAILLVLGASANHHAMAEETMFGLPAQATSKSETVGELPYTNQWISERTSSYLYVTYNSAQMGKSTLSVGQYVADFGNTGYAFPAVDFFTRFGSLAGPESRSALRDFSIWGRYSLGFADRSAKLSSTGTPISSAENDSLLVFSARIGALLGYERSRWIRPYAGFEIDPYFFRNTAGISGAEEQGANFSYGPVLGAHFPLFFDGRGSIVAEYRHVIPVSGSGGQLYTNSNNYTAGMGLAF